MMNSIVIFFRFLFSNKWKLALTFFMTLGFLFVLFPLSDLNDLISTQVSKLTNNTVFLQFEKMRLNPMTASVSLEKVYVETPQINSISSDALDVSPSISALLARKPGGKITAKGFLKGEVEVSMHPTTGASGANKSKFEVVANNLSLKEAREAANISLPIKGELSLTSQAIADLSFTEQPELDLTVTIMRFELAATSIPLQDFGQIGLPEIKFGKIEMKGRLSNGKFVIENGKLGTNKDDLYGDIKGELAVSFQNVGGQVAPVIGSYDISVDIKATPKFKDKAKLFLSFLDGYRVGSGAVSNYKFKISAVQMGLPPQFTPLR